MEETIKKEKNYFLWYVIGLGLIVFLIVLIRAVTTAITWDEAYTYVNYAKQFDINQLIDIHSNYANNHILNTLMIFGTDQLCNLPYNEFIIRLPNIIMLVFYFIGSYLFTKDEKHKYLLFSGLILNYYVMEFFGLGRGYGIAACLIIWMCYFFKKAVNSDYKDKYVMLSCLLGTAACYANTVSILAVGTIGIVYFIKLFKKKEIFNFLKRNILKIIPIIILLVYIMIFHFIVTGSDKPVFGEVEGSNLIGFFKHSFIWMFIQNGTVNIVLTVIGLIVLAFSIIFYRKKIKEKPFFLAFIVFLLCLIMPSIILKKPFLVERCLIPLWPLFIIGVVEIYGLLTENRPKMLVKTLSIICILFLGLSFAKKIDLKGTRDWNDNYKVKDIVYNALYEHRKLNEEEYNEIKKFYGITFYSEKIIEQYGFDVIPR